MTHNLNSQQVDRVRRYLCRNGASFRKCDQCPFFSSPTKCSTRRKIYPRDFINEIARAWEEVRDRK